MRGWLKAICGVPARRPDIPEELWQQTLSRFRFLVTRGDRTQAGLRQLTRQFLHQKEFHGAAGFQITDEIAVAIAAQACLAVLHIRAPPLGLEWYDDFVGIVVHAGPVLAQRETVDEAGVVHCHGEVLTGEAMQDGPVTLSWQDVADAGRSAQQGYNVVIHEFVHKIDMRGGAPDGCPALTKGFMGATTAAAAREAWTATLQARYQEFCDQLSIAERFGGDAPWLDPYASHSIDEFFAVVSEAYFVNPANFKRDFFALVPMFDAFFNAPDRPD